MRWRSAATAILITTIAITACVGPLDRSAKRDTYAGVPDACLLLDDGVSHEYLGAGPTQEGVTEATDRKSCEWKRTASAAGAQWESLGVWASLYKSDSSKSGEERAKEQYGHRPEDAMLHKCEIAAGDCSYRVGGTRGSEADPPRVDVYVRRDNLIVQAGLLGENASVEQPERMAPVASRLARSLGKYIEIHVPRTVD